MSDECLGGPGLTEILEALESEPEGPKVPPEFHGRVAAWKATCYALLANNGGYGLVLYHGGGPSLEEVLREKGDVDLEELDLSEGPEGLSVWEGYYDFEATGLDEWDYFPVGKFREPTNKEWKAIRKGVSPWTTSVQS